MKLALLQLNYIVGDLDHNADKIIHAAKSLAGKADLCITSELALTGYPPKDLLLFDGFIQAALAKIEVVAYALKDGPAMLMGCVVPNPSGIGKPLYNAAVFLYEGQIKQFFYKKLLPTYDVFDEDRYFEPGRASPFLEFQDKTFGVTICEDIWNKDGQWYFPRYHSNPLEMFASSAVDGIINLSASPYVVDKHKTIRQPLMHEWATRYQIPFFYVNQIGGNDELIFDGASICVNSSGECVAKANSFAEDILLIDMQLDLKEPIVPSYISIEEEVFQALVCGVRDYAQKCRFKKVILGLSGGIDSALTLVIAVHALGAEQVIAVLMPSQYSSSGSVDDALQLANELGVQTIQCPIHSIMITYDESLKAMFQNLPKDSTEENIQARIRGNILMALSNKWNALLLTTGNKSELSVGYCTIYGDMCGGLAVISDVYKTMVYNISQWYNQSMCRIVIPKSTLEKPASAELRPDQTDQDSLPPYAILDEVLFHFIERRLSIDSIVQLGFRKELVQSIIQLVTKAEFKRRQAAPGLKITSCAYGAGWRMPIAAFYQYEQPEIQQLQTEQA